MTETPRNENMIAALKRERAQYAARGEDDRVHQVDEQLLHYGCQPSGQDPVTAADGGPQGRTPQAGQRTADGGTAAKTAEPEPPADSEPADGDGQGETKKAPAKKTTAPAKKTTAAKRAQSSPGGD